MLTRLDDFPIHQTPEPVAHPSTGDRNFYDRYFFNGYSRSGDLFFAVALGLYPNRRVMDAAVSVVRGGTQYVVRASRRAPLERTELEVPPIRLDVLEPMVELRLTVAPNEHGIEGELAFRARTEALEEPRFRRLAGPRATFDLTRFAQFGTWAGRLRVAGEEIAIRPQDVLGCRDRSWGVRGVGEPEGGAPDEGASRQFYWLWAPINYEDGATHFGRNEDADGFAWHENAVVAPLIGGGEPERMVASRSEIEWAPGTRRASAARLELSRRGGGVHEVRLEPVQTFFMHGIGYGAGEWAHGRWVGEHAVTGEAYETGSVQPLDPRFIHIQALCRAVRRDPDGSEHEGIGVLEQLAVGPHTPSGFTGALDGAR